MNEFLRKYSVNRNFFTFACLLARSCPPSLDGFDFDHFCFHSIDTISPVPKKKHRQEQTILLTCCAVAAVAQFVLKRGLTSCHPLLSQWQYAEDRLLAKYDFKFAMGGDQYRAVISTLVIDSQMNHSLVKTHPAHNNKKLETVRQLSIAKHNGPHNISQLILQNNVGALW
jgi:hypothetical protein